MRNIVIILMVLLLLAPLNVLLSTSRESADIRIKDIVPAKRDSEVLTRDDEIEPYDIVFTDDFEGGHPPNPAKWSVTTGVAINQNGDNEPSGVNSANLDGGGDTLTSVAIALSNYGFGRLSFYLEPGASQDDPEEGDDIIVWLSLTVGWFRVYIHPGFGAAATTFMRINISLPRSAFHANFQVKFETLSGDAGADDWFIDNVSVEAKAGVVQFFDDFPNQVISAAKWPAGQREGSPLVNNVAQNIPSGTLALNLDGSTDGDDTLVSNSIDLSHYNEGCVFYFWEQGDGSNGDRDEPEAGDDLRVEYLTEHMFWFPLETSLMHFGFDPGTSYFLLSTAQLGHDAFHAQFKIRILGPQGDGANTDDWFVDNVGVITASSTLSSMVFKDDFTDTSLDNQEWPAQNGPPQVNTDGNDEPSPPNSLNLDGSVDTVTTRAINLSGAAWAVLSYWWEQGDGQGNRNEPEAGDDLVIEVKLNSGWREIKRHLGVTPGTARFKMEEFPLPQRAFNDQFQVRISTTQGDGANTDDWFVDNVRVVKGKMENPKYLEEVFMDEALGSQWEVLRGDVKVTNKANNEPSPDYSMTLDGERDIVISPGVNLSHMNSARFSFHWQQGNGVGNNEPDNGDDLFVDILFSSGWFNIFHEEGNTQGTNQFTNFSFVLPDVALHNNFKARFRVNSNDGANQDDWFIDNMSIREVRGGITTKIGVYYEYSDREEEGINPIKAFGELFDMYQLFLFDDYKYAAENLSQLNLFIISEQAQLTAQTAGQIHNHWQADMNDYFNNTIPGGAKMIVLDGGEGNSRLLVSSFIGTTGHQAISGNVQIDRPNHPVCGGINAFAAPANTAFFNGVDGRVLMSVNNNPVVVEKRCGHGSIMLAGFDFTEWNVQTSTLIENTFQWFVENEMDISVPVINLTEVYAGLCPVKITVDAYNTIGPDDVTGLDLEFLDTGVSISYNGISPSVTGSSVTLDSWYAEKTVENLTLHLNLTFGWDFPAGATSVNVSANGDFIPEIVTNSTESLFSVENKVVFLGDLTAKNRNGEVLADGGLTGSGEELTFSGVTLVYNGTEEVYPPDDQFDLEIWSEDGQHWTDANSSGRDVSIVATTPDLVSDDYVFYLNLTGAATANSAPSGSFHVKIDNTQPVFSNPIPGTGAGWHAGKDVNCSIEVTDTGVAGVEHVTYSYSTDNGEIWSDWSAVDSLEDGVASQVITFEDGQGNLVRWNATDSVGNGPVVSSPYNVSVDSIAPEFSSFTPTEPVDTMTPTCEIEVTDLTSRVSQADLWARVSIDYGITWGGWEQPEITAITNGYKLTYAASCVEGNRNRVQWKAQDVAGNTNISQAHIVTVDTSTTIPAVRLISPADTATEGTRPTLSWDLEKGGTGISYRLFVANTSDIELDNDSAVLETLDNNTYTFEKELEAGTTYFWTVIPIKGEGGDAVTGSCVSGVWSFTVKAGWTPEVSLVSPPNSATQNEKPTLTWELVNGNSTGVSYKLFVNNSGIPVTNNNDSLKTVLTSTSYTFSEELENGTYNWCVIPIRNDGDSIIEGICQSGAWSFTVERGFKPIWNFSFNVTIRDAVREYLPGDTVNITITLNNSGNNPDSFSLWTTTNNLTITGFGTPTVPMETLKRFNVSLGLPTSLEPGQLVINLTITSLEGRITQNELLTITIAAIDDPTPNGKKDSSNEQGFLSNIPWLWVAIGVGALLVIIIIVIIIRRRDDDDWDEDEDDDDYYDDDDDDEDEDEEDEFGRISKDVPAQTQAAPMKMCTNCRQTIAANILFCTHCGSKQEKEQQPQFPTIATQPLLPQTTATAAIPMESLDEDSEKQISLTELMNRASMLIEEEKETPMETAPVQVPVATMPVPVTEPEEKKEYALDEITSVDQLLDIVVVAAEPLEDDDDEDIIEVVATSPLEEEPDAPLPMPTIPVMALDEDDEEEFDLPPPSLTLEAVMMEVVADDVPEGPPDDRDPIGVAPPPPPPPE